MTISPKNCQIASFFIGIAKICYMAAPVGQCDYCCTLDAATDVQYQLFTRSNPTQFQVISEDVNLISSTSFNRLQPTVIYIFGFSESADGPSTTALRNAYLLSGDYNFIVVDWSRLVAFPWYVTAVQNSRYMGERLALFIEFLEKIGVPASSVHVVGFSLGAEAAGLAGKILKSNRVRIGRITGLDPAYPGYSVARRTERLSKGDAIFVDVVHTNPGVFGYPEAIGDVDFYPNPGGWIQPGCWIDQLVKNKEFRFVYGCSHVRAWRLYAESVANPIGFPATLCRDWTSATATCQFETNGYMGFGARRPMRGKMYLKTNDKPPFARNGP